MTSPNEATSAFINEISRGKWIKKRSSVPTSNFLLVPIVCTNANLKTAKYNKKDIDISSGNIKLENIEFENVHSVFYKFPMGYGVSPLHTGYNIEKRLTVIANSERIGDVIDLLLTNFNNYLNFEQPSN